MTGVIQGLMRGPCRDALANFAVKSNGREQILCVKAPDAVPSLHSVLDESSIPGGTPNSYEASLVGYESYDWL